MNAIHKPAERRKFKMHEHMLWSVIQRQAGTIGKAVLELVMNSVDAQAHTVEIELTGEGVVVQDDGKGFTNRSEIENFFETFGTPHQDGDATFGFFRMGRGQVMSFSKNHWRSGTFEMSVDIKHMGLEYDLVEHDTSVQGCRIEAQLYEPLKPSQVIRLQDEIRELCKYVPVNLILNGEAISTPVASMKWTFEDDDAYYQIRDGASCMEFYNLGVHLRSYHQGEFGVCGLVVTKKQVKVNFARNDVLQSQCEIFKRIASVLRERAKSDNAERPRNNEAHRELALSMLLLGSMDTAEEYANALCESKVVTDYSGKHWSLSALAAECRRGRIVCVANDFSTRADKVHQSKLAIVISPKTMARARNMAFPNVLQRVISNLRQIATGPYHHSIAGELETLMHSLADLNVVGAMIDDSKKFLSHKELNKEEKLVLSVLENVSWMIVRSVDAKRIRRLGAFESESFDGLTDGQSLVYLNRKFLKVGGGAGQIFAAFESLKIVLLHEYCHDEDDSTGHSHPLEFYEKFHDLLSFQPHLERFVVEAVRLFLAGRRRSGMKMRSGDLHALDLLLSEPLKEPDIATEADWDQAHGTQHEQVTVEPAGT